MTQAPANAIRLANEIGQSIWLDSISRELIRSGELARLFGLGVSGVTSNPTIFEKAVSEGASYDDALLLHAEAGGGAGAAFSKNWRSRTSATLRTSCRASTKRPVAKTATSASK